MRIASFEIEGIASYGLISGDVIKAPGPSFLQRHPDLRSVLRNGALAELEKELSGVAHSLSAVRFLPPIPNPDKILCVGVNYRPHIEEMGREEPDYPVVFVRFPGSQVGHNQALIRPTISEKFDFEGELAIVIGKTARHVASKDALSYVAGYSCFMDGSVRDWQRHTMQFTAGKNFDRSGSMGPILLTGDEVEDPRELRLTTRVNGISMQKGKLADLVFDIPALIEYCSVFTKLLPGDVIATGTPGGVGAARTPPVWLKHGDAVEVEISAIGKLCNSVEDET